MSVGELFIPVISYWHTGENHGNHVTDPQGDVDTTDHQESFPEAGRRENTVVKQEDRDFYDIDCTGEKKLCRPLYLTK